MPNPVNSKRDFVRRYALGEFGNKAPTWTCLRDYLKSGYSGDVHIRNRIVGGLTWYNVPHYMVKHNVESFIYHGEVNEEDLYYSGMSPHEFHGTIQGEVMQTVGGLYLRRVSATVPMREALSTLKVVETVGLVSLVTLRTYLCPRSMEWLQWLLEAYPDHVIEFSSFDVEWGDISGYNTCFWEVRKYVLLFTTSLLGVLYG